MLIKGIGVTNQNEANEQKGGFIPMLLGTLTASLLRSVLTGTGAIGLGERVIRAGENV